MRHEGLLRYMGPATGRRQEQSCCLRIQALSVADLLATQSLASCAIWLS